MKRFIFTLLFVLALGAGQTFAFDDVGEQQTVVTEQSDLFSFETFEARELNADVLVTHTTEQGKHALFDFRRMPKVERIRQTPAPITESKQEVVLAEKLPPNRKAGRSV